MSNTEAIQTLKLMLSQVEWDYPMEYSAAIDEAIKALEAQKWVPCSERLPEEIDTYLVTLDYKEHGTGITTLWFHGLLGWDFPVADVVTAWMPLPQPYKAESEEL